MKLNVRKDAISRHDSPIAYLFRSFSKNAFMGDKSFLKEDSAYYVRSDSSGALAITHFKVVKTSGSYSYINLHLETGKKNQVRVHAQEAGHPIVGDHKYGANSSPFNRLGLHAHLLTFFHPTKNKQMVFKSKLPKVFQFRGFDENNH